MIWVETLTTSLWVFAIRLSSAETLGLRCWVIQVPAEIANIAELRVTQKEEPTSTDTLQRGKIYLLQSRVT